MLRASLIASALLAGSHAAAPHARRLEDDVHEITGTADGTFELLGTLCFPEGSDETISFSATTNVADIQLLVYDDEDTSFPTVNEGDLSCEDREALAKDQHEMAVAGDHSFSISISESYGREWYFVAARCSDDGEPVDMTYTMTSSSAVDCDDLHHYDIVPYVVAIVMLSIGVVALGALAFAYKRRLDNGPQLSHPVDDTSYSAL